MTDRYTDHRAAAEGLLADADDWGWQAGESSPEASELSCLAYGTLHALLAIHDTLLAKEAAQETPRVDPSASQDECGAGEGGGAPTPSTRLSPACVKRWPDCAPSEYNPSCCRFPKSCSPLDTDGAQEPLVCPECDHHINVHDVDGCLLTRCDCPRTPEDVALALIARAVSVDIEDAR